MSLRIGLRVEGQSDFDFFEVLIRRLVESIATREIALTIISAARLERSIERIAAQLCAAQGNAADLFCIHQDADSRNKLERKHSFVQEIKRKAYDFCQLPSSRCVALIPLRETETWLLADPAAVCYSLGIKRVPAEIQPGFGKPEDIEDPKERLRTLCESLLGRRRNSPLSFPRVAELIRFGELRRLPEYRRFEASFVEALQSINMPIVQPVD